jgi:hypothetical protein
MSLTDEERRLLDSENRKMRIKEEAEKMPELEDFNEVDDEEDDKY